MDLPLLVTNPTNIRYLTGFVGAAPEEREAYCLIAQDSIYLFTNTLYLEQSRNLKSQIPMTKRDTITVVEISQEEPFAKKLKEILSSVIPAYAGIQSKQSWIPGQARNDKQIKLGFEEYDLTVAEYHKIMLEHKNVRLVPTKDRIETLRMIKRDDEIEDIRLAANLTDQCFEFILEKLKPGITETDIAWEIEAFIRSHGAEVAFSPIVAFGKNTSHPHYIANFTMPRLEIEAPQGEALKKQDIALLDFGARVNGYCSDMTRVVFIGHPDEEWQNAYRVVLRAQKSALNTILRCIDTSKRTNKSLNISGAFLDRTAREEISKAGFPPYPHSLGHGVGLDIHEAPRLTIKKNTLLKPNMVITVEPAIYIEGNYGIRIEDLVLLKSDGIEILSRTSKRMTIL